MSTLSKFPINQLGSKTSFFEPYDFEAFLMVYVAEISPAKQRGKIGSFLEMSVSLGLFTIYILSSIDNFRYSDSSLVLVGFVALFTVSMTFFCETPRWLLSCGQKQHAIAVLKFLRGPKYDISSELKIIQSNIDSSPHLKINQVFIEFTKGNVFVPMILVLILVMFQQCGGLGPTGSYAALILKEAGVFDFRRTAVYGVGCAGLISNVAAAFLTDYLGRKILLVTSSIGTLLGTTLLGVHFYVTRPSTCLPAMNSSNVSFVMSVTSEDSAIQLNKVVCNVEYAPLAIVAIVVYYAGFSIGWGPVVWLVLGELLPLQVRGVGTGIATFVMWASAAVLTGTYLNYVDAVQPWFVWWTYSIVNALSILFVAFCIFETKGRSLEDIQQRFENKYGNIKFL